MNISPLLKFGVVGTVISALCCFTPLLVVVFSTLGLSAVIGWLDYVLLPTLLFFVILTIYALIRRSKLAKQG